jgi:hypothetical protein
MYVSSYYYYMSLLVYVCPHITVRVSSYYYMCPHTAICVLILLCVCPHAGAARREVRLR